MGTDVTGTESKEITFNSNAFRKYLDKVDAPHLALFIGLFGPDKKRAVGKLSKASGRGVTRYDFNDLVSKIEKETFRAIDTFFADLNGTNNILFFSNGDNLCGAYTGFSYSRVKYATPQERYFLKKLNEQRDLIVIISISEPDGADETLIRAADVIVKFPLSKSPIRRLFWQLKNYSLHGYDFKTKRPESFVHEGTVTN